MYVTGIINAGLILGQYTIHIYLKRVTWVVNTTGSHGPMIDD